MSLHYEGKDMPWEIVLHDVIALSSRGVGRQGLWYFLCVRLRTCGSHVMSGWFSQSNISTPVFYLDPNMSV